MRIFDVEDLQNPHLLIEKLQDREDLASQYILSQCSPNFRQIVDDYSHSTSVLPSTKGLIVEEFNRLVSANTLLYTTDISNVLPDKTRRVVEYCESHKPRSNIRRTNRRIIEALYGSYFHKYRISDRTYKRAANHIATSRGIKEILGHLLNVAYKLDFHRIRYYRLSAVGMQSSMGMKLVSAGSAGHPRKLSEDLAEGQILKYSKLCPRNRCDAFKCIPTNPKGVKSGIPIVFSFKPGIKSIEEISSNEEYPFKICYVPEQDCENLLRSEKSRVWVNFPLIVGKRCVGKLSCDWGDMPLELDPVSKRAMRKFQDIASFAAPYFEYMHEQRMSTTIKEVQGKEIPEIDKCETLEDLFHYCTEILVKNRHSDHASIFTVHEDTLSIKKLVLRKTSYEASWSSENCRSYMVEEGGLTPWVARHNAPLRLQALDNTGRTVGDLRSRDLDLKWANRIQDSDKHGKLLAVPIANENGGVMGVLRLTRKSGDSTRLFTDEDERYLHYVANAHIAPKLAQLPWSNYERESSVNRDTFSKLSLKGPDRDSVIYTLLDESYGDWTSYSSPLVNRGQIRRGVGNELIILPDLLNPHNALSLEILKHGSEGFIAELREVYGSKVSLGDEDADNIAEQIGEMFNAFLSSESYIPQKWVANVALRKKSEFAVAGASARMDPQHQVKLPHYRRMLIEDVYAGSIARIGNVFLVNWLDKTKGFFRHRVIGGALSEEEIEKLRHEKTSMEGSITKFAMDHHNGCVFLNDLGVAIASGQITNAVKEIWPDALCATACRIANLQGESNGAVVVLSSVYEHQDAIKGKLLEDIASRIEYLYARNEATELQFTLGGMQHDLVTPLDQVQWFITDGDIKNVIQQKIALRKLDFLKAIVGSYSVTEWEPQKFNVYDHIRIAMAEAQNEQDPLQRIKFNPPIEHDLCVSSFPLPMVAILYNLFKNSLADLRKSTSPEEKFITVKTVLRGEEDGNWLQIIVEDNGRGLSKTEEQKIYFPDLFLQSITEEEKQKGRGLLLTMKLLGRCRLGERCGGMEYKSGQEDSRKGGSAFIIRLPILKSTYEKIQNVDLIF